MAPGVSVMSRFVKLSLITSGRVEEIQPISLHCLHHCPACVVSGCVRRIIDKAQDEMCPCSCHLWQRHSDENAISFSSRTWHTQDLSLSLIHTHIYIQEAVLSMATKETSHSGAWL